MTGARYDAIVIGGSVSGLVASAYLARAGRRVVLLEAADVLGGSCQAATSLVGVRASLGVHALYALDPRVVKELGLSRRGLKFAVRDMPLMILRQGGSSLVLSRDAHSAARAISGHSAADTIAYRHFRTEMFALAMAMRPVWWENASLSPRPGKASQRRLLAQLEATSTSDFLTGRFESDALKAALAFDVPSPFEPGSPLALVWRASQEMCGLQGAVATLRGGPAALADVLGAAASEAGAEVRTKAGVTGIILAGSTAAGVELKTGEVIFGRTVISCLSRSDTLLGLAPNASIGFDETFALRQSRSQSGDAAILFLLNAAPDVGGKDAQQTSRFVIADRIEVFAERENAAREGRLPDELLIEAVVPTAADPSLAPPGQHLLSVCVSGVPLAPGKSWSALSAKLAERVVAALEPHVTHLRERIVGIAMQSPTQTAGFSSTRMLSSYVERTGTPIEGLFLCGPAAEPADAISGRAGRIAANIANGWLARENRP